MQKKKLFYVSKTAKILEVTRGRKSEDEKKSNGEEDFWKWKLSFREPEPNLVKINSCYYS